MATLNQTVHSSAVGSAPEAGAWRGVILVSPQSAEHLVDPLSSLQGKTLALVAQLLQVKAPSLAEGMKKATGSSCRWRQPQAPLPPFPSPAGLYSSAPAASQGL